MLRFAVRRLMLAVLTLFAVSVITFTLFFAVPSDPAATLCAKECPAEVIEEIREGLGLDRPIVEQYADYMTGIFVGRTIGDGALAKECEAPCLGYSFHGNRPVWDSIVRALPITASIALGAWVLQTLIGVSLGVWAALRRGTLVDKAVVGSTLVGAAMPVYFFAALLLMIFVFQTDLISRPKWPDEFDPLGWLGVMILPWISIALIGFATEARMSRATMLETMSEDFVRTAQAKGLSTKVVHRKHALRAAITPVITLAGLNIGFLLGGAVITESVFGLRGLGQISVLAVQNLDMPIVMGTVMVSAVFIVVSTMAVDFLYAVIDPRVRLN